MISAKNLSKIKILLLVALTGLLAGCSPAFWTALDRSTNDGYGGGQPYKAIAVAKNDNGASVSAYGISYVSLSDAEIKALSKCNAKRKRNDINNRCKLMHKRAG